MSMSIILGPQRNVFLRPIFFSICFSAERSLWGESPVSISQTALKKPGCFLNPQGLVLYMEEHLLMTIFSLEFNSSSALSMFFLLLPRLVPTPIYAFNMKNLPVKFLYPRESFFYPFDRLG